MLRYVFKYKFSILLLVIIAILSLIPSSSMPDTPLYSVPYIDKIAHMLMYASLGFVALMESSCEKRCLAFRLLLVSALFCLSAAIEVMQATLIPSRAAEWTDLVANFSGLVGAYFAFLIANRFGWFGFLRS